MLHRTSLLTAIAAVALFGAPVALSPNGPGIFAASSALAATSVKIDIFFSTLQPYGGWVHHPDYNYVWIPTGVDRNWSPYTHGHWIYTKRYGWYFESDEPFAPIVYHYGRWGYDRAIGWYWVPGTKWGPAWVAWRRGETHVGWAPLPPERRGYETGVSINIDINIIPQDHWFFVDAPRFLQPNLTRVVVRGDRDRDVYARSKPLGSVIVQNNIVINNVINIDFIQQQTKQKVEVRKIDEVADPKQATQSPGDKGAVKAFVAEVEQPAATAKPAQSVERQDVEKKPPPTAGTASASVAPAQTGGAAAAPATGQPAPAPVQAQPCVDTDPKMEGCQPAPGNAATAPADQGKGPPAASVTAPDAKPVAPNAVVEPPKVNPPAEPPKGNAAPAADKAGKPAEACANDADPQKPGCQQADAAAGKAAPAPGTQGAVPPPAAGPQGNAGPPAGKEPGSANPSSAGNNADCKVDTDPKQPGCQPAKAQ